MSHTVISATEIEANKVYYGSQLLGTGIEFLEDTKVSINGTVFTTFVKDHELYKVDTHTYVFKENCKIRNLFLQKPTYSESYEARSSADVALVATTESADIVLLTNNGQSVTAISEGEISSFFRIRNDGTGSATVSIQFYKTAVAYRSPVVATLQNGETLDVSRSLLIDSASPFAVTDNVSFRVTSDKTATILGTETDSILRIRRDNL